MCAALADAAVAPLAQAHGRYLVAPEFVTIEDVFAALKELYPSMPVAEMTNMDIASGVPGKARKIASRTPAELGLEMTGYKAALKDAVDSMVAQKIIAVAA